MMRQPLRPSHVPHGRKVLTYFRDTARAKVLAYFGDTAKVLAYFRDTRDTSVSLKYASTFARDHLLR